MEQTLSPPSEVNREQVSVVTSVTGHLPLDVDQDLEIQSTLLILLKVAGQKISNIYQLMQLVTWLRTSKLLL